MISMRVLLQSVTVAAQDKHRTAKEGWKQCAPRENTPVAVTASLHTCWSLGC